MDFSKFVEFYFLTHIIKVVESINNYTFDMLRTFLTSKTQTDNENEGLMKRYGH